MKRNLTKFIGIALVSSLAFSACQPKKVEESPIGLLLAAAIRSAASGNCAISLNLGTLYSGAIIQISVNTATIFTQAEFEQASNTTVGAGHTYTTYASVPYNVKYDAFINGGGTYGVTARTADISTGRLEVLKNAYVGASAATCLANSLATANSPATGFRSGSTAVSGSLSAAEITELTTHLLTFPFGGQTSFAVIEGGVITASCATFQTNVGGAAVLQALAGAYQARQAFANGTAILACARIPRASCTFAGLTVLDRETAISNAGKAIDTVSTNTACRKTNADFQNSLVRASFVGTPRGTVITSATTSGSFTTSTTDPYRVVSEGSTFPNNRIYATRGYPISPALSNISTAFTVAFPLTTGTVAQPSSSPIAYHGASNINIAQVESCESIGMPGHGPVDGPPADATALALRKDLTSVTEIAYAFSSENTAAALYASVGLAADAIACNNSFRSKFRISVAIGGGTLPVLNSATSGDGGATSNLTTCLYGGTLAGRTTSGSLLGATALAGIQSCPAAATAGAAKFGDTGLEKLTNFPNND